LLVLTDPAGRVACEPSPWARRLTRVAQPVVLGVDDRRDLGGTKVAVAALPGSISATRSSPTDHSGGDA
jgi:hypothetical protein